MAATDPGNTTVRDICTEALRECGAFGQGTTPNNVDITGAWSRLQWMLQEWQNKRWNVFHLVNLSVVCTGAQSYSIGPGGQIDTGTLSMRPSQIESAFLRQITVDENAIIDYPLTIIRAREDYDRIALKSLKTFATWLFYDSGWPLGQVYPWPLPLNSQYEIHVSVRAQLPAQLPNLSQVFNIPFNYYSAMVANLAMRLRAKYSIPTMPGDYLAQMAQESLQVLQLANAQIGNLNMPDILVNSNSGYNIFSDGP